MRRLKNVVKCWRWEGWSAMPPSSQWSHGTEMAGCWRPRCAFIAVASMSNSSTTVSGGQVRLTIASGKHKRTINLWCDVDLLDVGNKKKNDMIQPAYDCFFSFVDGCLQALCLSSQISLPMNINLSDDRPSPDEKWQIVRRNSTSVVARMISFDLEQLEKVSRLVWNLCVDKLTFS